MITNQIFPKSHSKQLQNNNSNTITVTKLKPKHKKFHNKYFKQHNFNEFKRFKISKIAGIKFN